MLTPETRVIHQSTYTPIIPHKEEQICAIAQPFLKKYLLLTVFPESKAGQIVLDTMKEIQHDHTLPQFDKIVAAIGKAWSGDLFGCVNILRTIDMEDITCFAQKGLETETSLIEKARNDVQASVLAIQQHLQAETDVKTQIHQEFGAMRESILSQVQEMIAPLKAAQASQQIHTETHGTRTERAANLPEMARGVNSAAIAPVSATVTTFQPMISAKALREELTQVAPLSRTYLDSLGAFPSNLLMDVGPAPFADVLDFQANLTTARKNALQTSIQNKPIEPMGYLHLERLQFTPLGYELGELVYSLPMLPGETVRLSHREWSRTETEFAKLISTEMETATEEAISEKSELTQSSNTQQQHSSAYNASVSAGYSGAGFNISTSFGYNCNNSESSSKQYASKQAQDITKKASSRAKKDAKTSFKITTTYEVEEQSYREITNKTSRAVRYDFHRLMKKWRIDLYRYDVRMTYDIVIPEPGGYLLRKYILLKDLNDELAKPNPFDLAPSSITRGGGGSQKPTDWDVLAKQYGVALSGPLPESCPFSAQGEIKFAQQYEGRGVLEIVLPEGYEFDTWNGQDYAKNDFVKGNDDTLWPQDLGYLDPLQQYNTNRLNAGLKHSNRFLWEYDYIWYGAINQCPSKESLSMPIIVDGSGKLSEAKFKEWQMECFNTLADAAKTKYENQQILLRQMRDDLVNELEREDALMLRKIEKEELMKGVLRWLLGPNFDLYPKGLLGLPSNKGLSADEFYDPVTQSVNPLYWEPGLRYGEMIKFLHQAIEWENVNYILYPYFWTDPAYKPRWDFKQSLYHADYVHRNFLRAGAARVVLTIRPGFEKQFLSFMEGQLDTLLEGDHQYMTVADELKAMAMTKYPYTQDANVEKGEFLFTWENVPGNTAETDHLLDFLEEDLFANWSYLFCLRPIYLKELDQQVISNGLAQAFSDHNHPLQHNAAVEVNRAMLNWTITNGLNTKYFFIRSTGQTLDVYDRQHRPVLARDGNTIRITEGADCVEITRDDQQHTAVLKASDGRTLDLNLREEGGQHRIYKSQNWVDTWYEFTPTGALDVEVGNISPVLATDEENVPA